MEFNSIDQVLQNNQDILSLLLKYKLKVSVDEFLRMSKYITSVQFADYDFQSGNLILNTVNHCSSCEFSFHTDNLLKNIKLHLEAQNESRELKNIQIKKIIFMLKKNS